jgi:hypothetical protein
MTQPTVDASVGKRAVVVLSGLVVYRTAKVRGTSYRITVPAKS